MVGPSARIPEQRVIPAPHGAGKCQYSLCVKDKPEPRRARKATSLCGPVLVTLGQSVSVQPASMGASTTEICGNRFQLRLFADI
jgi:hypothetical protein